MSSVANDFKPGKKHLFYIIRTGLYNKVNEHQQLLAGRTPNAKDVSQSDFDSHVTGQIHPCNTRHMNVSPLSLPLQSQAAGLSPDAACASDFHR